MASKKEERLNDGMMLGIHLDVGHSSIGWAVTETSIPVVFRGCGTVLFPADSCLASKRRANRRQRRHIRSTRQRIGRMRVLLAHLGVMGETDLERPGCGWPWKLAAEVLTQGRLLTWPELWDVLRWYAHNRGYDNNELWQRKSSSVKEDKETTKSLQSAQSLMTTHGTTTMAETVCAVMEIAPGGSKSASMKRYKAARASFPRKVVHSEVRRIVDAHAGKLAGLDEKLIRMLLGSAVEDGAAWKSIPCPGIVLPRRYAGGVLFGQLLPRFDNRIIGLCPVSNEKKPLKSCPEFLEYRWAMLLANLRLVRQGPAELTASERKAVIDKLREEGYFTKDPFKKAVRKATGVEESNIDGMMMAPEADNALVLYPAVRETKSAEMKQVWDVLPANIQRRVLKRLAKGKSLTLGQIREWAADKDLFDQRLSEANKGKKKATDPLAKVLKANFPTGRAPYSRAVMRQAVAEVMEGKDPRMEGGVLYMVSREKPLAEDEIDRETNNHLVRNRLRIMRRVIEDIIAEYARGDKSLVAGVTVEVNRDVKDLSGKDMKQIAQELQLRTQRHSEAVEHVAEKLGIPADTVRPGLIRKVRVAMDLDWTCPYTGHKYCVCDLQEGSVDFDHIIPHSQRSSNSLDSLVLTFKPINAWKSDATSMDFIETNAANPVPGMPQLSIFSPDRYKKHVDKLKHMKMPHRDDQQRRDNRCKRMMVRSSDDAAMKGFTPRDLTVSSHLVTLASAVVREIFREQEAPPATCPIRGSITNEVRMQFKLMELLAKVNPAVIDTDGRLKIKSEIREVTHLHHAVDAMTLGLAATLIPVDGEVWALMLKRNLSPYEKEKLAKTGAFQFDAGGRAHLRPLDGETLRTMEECLSECRVATHIPSTRRGTILKENISGVVGVDGDMVTIQQQSRGTDGKIRRNPPKSFHVSRLVGILSQGVSKLQAIKGAIIISENFGVALLDPKPEVIRFHQVWRRLGEIKKRNKGVMPRVLRKGMIIRVAKGTYAGTWKIFSVKENAAGLALALGAPDAVTLQKNNAALSTLLKDGLEICEMGYTGVVRHDPPPD